MVNTATSLRENRGGIFKQIWSSELIPYFGINSSWNWFLLEQGIPSSHGNRAGNRVWRLTVTDEKSMSRLKINILWSMGNPLLRIDSNVQICFKIPPLISRYGQKVGPEGNILKQISMLESILRIGLRRGLPMLHKMLIFKRGIDFSSVRRQTLFPTLLLGEEESIPTGIDS